MSSDSLVNTRSLLMDSLRPHFKGKTAEKRLEAAVDDAVKSIAHLVSTSSGLKKKNIGATVMTESASVNKRISPRNL